MNNGLRYGGGIGDSIENPTHGSSSYWNFWIFSLSFFIIVNVLIINIIFGIIIDTFGELRDEREANEKAIEEKCYICGISRYEFETKFIIVYKLLKIF